jgi:hypothetical protein
MFASPLKTKLSIYPTTGRGVWIGLPGVRLRRRSAGLTLGFAALEAFADEPRELVPMCPDDLINALEKVLVERLCDSSATRPEGPLGAVRTAMHKMRRAVQRGPRVSPVQPPYPDVVNRLRSLPEHVRELLRRHYVFLEAEESICLSMNLTSKQFRKLRREAVDYVLMRRGFRGRGVDVGSPGSLPPMAGDDKAGPATSPSKGKD